MNSYIVAMICISHNCNDDIVILNCRDQSVEKLNCIFISSTLRVKSYYKTIACDTYRICSHDTIYATREGSDESRTTKAACNMRRLQRPVFNASYTNREGSDETRTINAYTNREGSDKTRTINPYTNREGSVDTRSINA